MVLCGEGDCGVCLLAFSRAERVPRLLHCHHTFCQACLEAMAAPSAPGGLGSPLSVRCPLCRRVTCVRRGLSLREALWVDSELWELIPSDKEDEEEGGTRDDQVEVPQASPRAECIGSSNKLKFRSFFRKFTLTKRPRERIVPSSNVEMKSWRRLSSEET
ncbi:RING finger protein 223 [Phyllopteryx taeniolatus]|uniref:RING finger protein 223 n=1 Tax=Phyllopteryx taeniolatus TaxID=161469 RepID=UPI002AD26679|nr:RING finger protein 223 [Phyllopteryx taeniolatus]